MKILAFDTSGKACSVALSDGNKEKVLHKIIPMQQTSLILPMIDDLLSSFSLRGNQLDAIAYGGGPGSFTGIRIACCVAQALSFANLIPIIQISSLAIMAETAFIETAWRKLLVAVDAKSQEVYWASYEYNEAGQLQSHQPEVRAKPDAITRPFETDWYGIGDGWDQYYSPLIKQLGFKPININGSLLPTAKALLNLAKIKYERGEFVSLQDAIPNYLR